VCGFIDSSTFDSYTDDSTLTISGNVPKISPPPFSTHMRVAIPYASGNKTCQMNVQAAAGTVSLTLTKYWNSTGDLTNCDGYFAYATNSNY
jgi:hypothetical protein